MRNSQYELFPDRSAEPFTADQHAFLRTPRCLYRTFDDVGSTSLFELLHPVVDSAHCDRYGVVSCDAASFDGGSWSRWMQTNWQWPLTSVGLYLVCIPVLTKVMAPRQPLQIRPLVALWNFGLSLFSVLGASYVVPALLVGDDGLLTRGFYASVCQHAAYYGCGDVGFWVLLFILSKFAELFDTLFLVLRKNTVIPLHWYHHATVLLYCWHSYVARIGTGLWYASMNYCVHSIMYFYFGLTQCGPTGRRIAKKFSILITLMQLSQMVVGIVVTVASITYHAHGRICYVSLLNSFLGLAMYTSYFILFFALFQTLYLNKKPKEPKEKAATKAKGEEEPAVDAWLVAKSLELELVVATSSDALNMCSEGL